MEQSRWKTPTNKLTYFQGTETTNGSNILCLEACNYEREGKLARRFLAEDMKQGGLLYDVNINNQDPD